MAASVRIEDEAFSDSRYVELAEYAGLADADHARSKMEHLWRQCTIEHRHNLPVSIVRHFLGANGVDAIVRARLGEVLDDGSVRIRGTKGRIEWLDNLRANGRKGGRPRRNRSKPSGSAQQKPDGEASGSANQNPPAPAPAPAPALKLVGAEPQPPKPKGKPKRALTELAADWQPNEQHEQFASRHGLTCARESDKFRNHAQAKALRYADWDAAFRNWLGKSAEFAQERRGQSNALSEIRHTNWLKPEAS